MTRREASRLLAGVLMVGGSGSARNNPLAAERWKTRPLVVVAGKEDDPAVMAVEADLARARDALAERQVVVFTVLGGVGRRDGRLLADDQTQALLAALRLGSGVEMTMLLVGKDGGVKLRRRVLGVPEILATIDSMPMRRSETGG